MVIKKEKIEKIINVVSRITFVIMIIMAINVLYHAIILPESMRKYQILFGIIFFVFIQTTMTDIHWWIDCKKNYKKNLGRCQYWPCRYQKECKYSKYYNSDEIEKQQPSA